MSDYKFTKVENDWQKAILERLSVEFEYMDDFISTHVQAGRRRALALTKLEEAAMWASKAVAKPEPKTEYIPSSSISGISVRHSCGAERRDETVALVTEQIS